VSKILNIDQMLNAAEDAGLPSFQLRTRQAEMVAESLGRDLAEFLDIKAGRAEWAFGILAVDFDPKYRSQECPLVIHKGDPGGDWDAPHEDIPGEPLVLRRPKNKKRRRPFMVWLKSHFLSKEVKEAL